MSFKEIRVGDYALRFYPSDNGWMCGITPEMMEALTAQPTKIFGPNLEQVLNSAGFYKRQPLTEEEIVEIAWDWKSGGPIDFARAIERKHGIGGEA
jgi:hypothetical protein